MEASAVWLWALRAGARRIGTWIFVGVLLLLVPLAARLSPFVHDHAAGPVATLWVSWSLPVGLAAISLAMGFLLQNAAVLDLLPLRVRAQGELGVLLGSLLFFWAFLTLGAVLGSSTPLEVLGAAGRAWPAALLLAAWGFLLLRAPGPASLRIAALWILLGGLPTLLDEAGIGVLFDLDRALEANRGGAGWVSSLMLPVGLGLLAAGIRPRPAETSR